MTAAFEPYQVWLGISPLDLPPNHYRLLAIDLFEPNPDVISHAAEWQLSCVRTFQTSEHAADSQRLADEILAAKECLLNPRTKAEYDRQLQADLAAKSRSQERPLPQPEGPVAVCHAASAPIPRPAKSTAPAVPPAATVSPAGEVTPVTAAVSPANWFGGKPSSLLALIGGANFAMLAVLTFFVVRQAGNRESDVAPQDHQRQLTPDRAVHSANIADPRELSSADENDEQLAASELANATQEPADSKPSQAPIDNAQPAAAIVLHQQPAESSVPVDVAVRTDTADKPAPPSGDSQSVPAAAADVAIAATSSPPKREPFPDDAAQDQARQVVREVFKEDYEAATTAEQKAALADELLTVASETKQDSAARFVLLREAWDLAVASSNADLLDRSTNDLGKWYESDVWELKSKSLSAAAQHARTASNWENVATLAIRLADDAVQADRSDDAEQFATTAIDAATKSGDAELKKQAQQRNQQVARYKAALDAVSQAVIALEQHPDDPQANSILGEHYCFVKQQWDHGLPFLAKGSDAKLAETAKLELAAPRRPSEQVQVADVWWDLAEAKESPLQDHVRTHAAQWYSEAAPNVSGLVKAKVEKRLALVRGAEPPAPADTASEPEEYRPDNRPRVMGMDIRKLRQGLLVVHFPMPPPQQTGENNLLVPPSEFANPIGSPGATNSLSPWTYQEQWNAVAYGYLKISVPGEYAFMSSSFCDRNALYVDGREVCYHDGENAIARITLKAGTVPIMSVGYVENRGMVNVQWQPPGQPALSPIPPALLYCLPQEK